MTVTHKLLTQLTPYLISAPDVQLGTDAPTSEHTTTNARHTKQASTIQGGSRLLTGPTYHALLVNCKEVVSGGDGSRQVGEQTRSLHDHILAAEDGREREEEFVSTSLLGIRRIALSPGFLV